MLVEIYIFFQIVAISLFIGSFFTKQEILWAITIVIFGVLMFTSYNVEYYVYEWDNVTSSYYPVAITHTYPYLTAINMLFFSLSVLLALFDLFDKYGSRAITGK